MHLCLITVHVKMKLLTLTVFLTALIAFSTCSRRENDDKYKEELNTALKKLSELAEKHKLNFTVLTSQKHHWANGDVKEVREYGVHLPPNDEHLTEPTVTDEVVQDWIQTIKELPGEIKARARSRTAHIIDGNTEKVDVTPTSTDDDDFYQTRLYKTLISVESNHKGFKVDNPSFESFYYINITDGDGKGERIEVIVGDTDMEVVKKSDSISEDEVKEIKEKMKEVFFKYDCHKVMGRVLKDHMNEKFANDKWQVIMNPGDEFYVPSKKYALVRTAHEEALVYAM